MISINFNPFHQYLALISVFMFMISCGSTRHLVNTPDKKLNRIWDDLHFAPDHHTGLCVYDLDKKKYIFTYKDDNYFTPASTTKILTLYASSQLLDDQLEAARYMSLGDTLILWGGGDPGTLYPDVDTTCALVEFIRSSHQTIVFSNAHFRAERFGRGWAWDDFPYAFQCERNAFPIFGNRLWIDRKQDSLHIIPEYLFPLVKVMTDTVVETGKSEWGDGYYYTYDPGQKTDQQQIPITFFKKDIQYCWSEATGHAISILDIPFEPAAQLIAGSPRDSLVKIMMQESDNFIAEQLLLACSLKSLNFMSDDEIIDELKKELLQDAPDKIGWVDGSGLSRYNRLTPRTIVWVLEKIYRDNGLPYIQMVFPAGGHSGTLKEAYAGNTAQPYLFAKTGSMKAVYCLSGFLVTRSGKRLAFSWMNNLSLIAHKDMAMEMEKLLLYLFEEY